MYFNLCYQLLIKNKLNKNYLQNLFIIYYLYMYFNLCYQLLIENKLNRNYLQNLFIIYYLFILIYDI